MNEFTRKLNETIMVLEEAEENAEVCGFSDVAEAIRPVLRTLYLMRFPERLTTPAP